MFIFFIEIDIFVNMEGKLLEAILLNQSAAISRLNLGPILFECVSEQEREREKEAKRETEIDMRSWQS